MLVRSLLAAVVVVLVAASDALAGMYSHYACMYPNGRSGAPLSAGSFGWQPVGDKIAGYTAFNECARGSGFGVRLTRETTSHAGNNFGWRYEPPPGTTARAYNVALSTYAQPDLGEVDAVEDGGRYFFRNIRQGQQGLPDSPVVVDAHNLTGVPLMWASCDAPDCTTASGEQIAHFYVHRARVDLADDAVPTGSVSGAAADENTWNGIEHFDVSASDAGAGVYRLLLQIDGKTAETTPASSLSSCRDVVPEDSNPYQFDSPKPCPDDARAGIDVDTPRLGDGPHTIAVIVEDAAGNSRTVFGPVARTVDNARPSDPILSPTLRLSVSSVRTRRSRVVVGFGRRATFAGLLRDANGVAIARAPVSVLARTAIPGAAFRQVGTVVTGPDGRFRYTAPAGPSRELRFVHERGGPGNVLLTGAGEADLRVRAGVTLRSTQTRLRNGQAVTFRGRVKGLRPGERKVVELRVLNGSRWMTFATTRTKRGQFSFQYRFTRTFQNVVYRFSARVRAETGFPYATGASRALRIRVRAR